LSIPVAALWDGRGRLVVNTGCVPLAVQRFAISGLVLDPSRLTLCPVDGALVQINGARVSGGAKIAAAKLGGRLGTTPITLETAGATVRLADRGFAIDGVQTRIGAPERVTRLDFATVTGRMTGQGVAGAFTGGSGQIANVPLLLGEAAGDWTLVNGALNLTGAMGVSDAAPTPRFKPLAARTVTLELVNGTITAAGTLFEPTTNTKVADVTLTHALGAGAGKADLNVPAIAFAKDKLQPDALTPLTFGVIADVNGSVSGEGHIAWNPDGVTSTGVFRTAGTDLAAAFGPVTGIATEIRFTDLLNLQSAPGQVATIRTLNPGIPVTDGTIRYQTLPGARVIDMPTHAPDYAVTEATLEDAWDLALREGVLPRMLLLLNPNNPLGTVYPPHAVAAMVRWCRERNVHLVVDEIYANSVFEGEFNALHFGSQKIVP
ncbi:MAG: aminotransferase class I/II-fold pyridoxal phosphate-dependent enzyme, partial [Sphingomonas sp.]